MNSTEFAVVFAPARCGLFCEKPTEAYVHQMTRLAEILPPDQAPSIQAQIDRHHGGRVLTPTRFAPR